MFKRLINFLVFVPAPKGKTKKVICNEHKCTFCGKCKQNCPQNAILVDKFTRIYYSYYIVDFRRPQRGRAKIFLCLYFSRTLESRFAPIL